MAKRLFVYVHGDAVSKGKGLGIARIVSQTDFAMNSDEMEAFGNKLAMVCYGLQTNDWKEIQSLASGGLNIAVDIVEKYEKLKADLKEEVTIDELMVILASNKAEEKKDTEEWKKSGA